MTAQIGSARHDENGNIVQGVPGDQTGLEVAMEAFYPHRKGWVVLRPKSQKDAEMIATACEMACRNDNIGYSQTDASTLYLAAKEFKFDVSRVNKPVNTDCSTLVRVCLAYAGIMVEWFSTANEKEILLKTADFDEITDKAVTEQGVGLKRGDILVTKAKGHTAVCIEDGQSTVAQPEVIYPVNKKVWCIVAGAGKNGFVYADEARTKSLKEYPKVSDGNGVTLCGQSLDGSTAYIQVDRYTGYLSAELLREAKTGQKPEILQSIGKASKKLSYVGKVTAVEAGGALKVHTGASWKASQVVAWQSLGVGNMVDVIGQNAAEDFLFLNIQGVKGWVKKAYVTAVGKV